MPKDSHSLADQRAIAAVDMRHREGLTFRAIGDRLGISAQAAHEAYKRGCRSLMPAEQVQEAREAALDRIDVLEEEAFRILRAQAPLVSHGRVIAGVQVHSLALAALDRIIRLEERRARIYGFDAPRKREVQVEVVTQETMSAEIARLAESLGMTDEELAGTMTIIDDQIATLREAAARSAT